MPLRIGHLEMKCRSVLPFRGESAIDTGEAVLFAGGQLVVEEVLALLQLRAERLPEAQRQRGSAYRSSRVTAVCSVRLAVRLPRVSAAVGRGARRRSASTFGRGGPELERVDPAQHLRNMYAMTCSIAACHRCPGSARRVVVASCSITGSSVATLSSAASWSRSSPSSSRVSKESKAPSPG